MATKTAEKKGSAKKGGAAKKGTSGNGRKSVTNRMAKSFRAEKVTFGVDDKRAQYARLVVFNFAVKEKILPKDADINDASVNPKLEKAGLNLVGGNLLDGPEALQMISELTKSGSTTGKPLTLAYSAEVRPFIKRLQLSDSFGNRGKGKSKKAESEEKASE